MKHERETRLRPCRPQAVERGWNAILRWAPPGGQETRREEVGCRCLTAAGEHTQTESRLGDQEVFWDRDGAGVGPGRYRSWDYSGVFSAASDVGSEGKESGMTPRGGGRAPGEMTPWSQAVTLSPGPKPSEKGQASSVKTRFGETSLAPKKKPRKHQCFCSLLIGIVMSDIHRSHPGPMQCSERLSEATLGQGHHSLQGSRSFPRGLLQSSSPIFPSLPEPTLRHLSCPARLTFHAVVTWVARLLSMTSASWRGCWGRPSALGLCLQNASGTFLRAHPRNHSPGALTHGAPGQQALQHHGKLVVGVGLHPLVPFLPNTV